LVPGCCAIGEFNFSKAWKRHGSSDGGVREATFTDAAATLCGRKKVRRCCQADGLAAGKGVVVAMTLGERMAISSCWHRPELQPWALPNAGSARVVVGVLQGEASFVVM
jgi:phosphoribosylamine-glycine ligase